jgi:hypothetical protein
MEFFLWVCTGPLSDLRDDAIAQVVSCWLPTIDDPGLIPCQDLLRTNWHWGKFC